MKAEHTYTGEQVIEILDARVQMVYEVVQCEPAWQTVFAAKADVSTIQAVLREIFLSVYWYQRHTTEAGFHMIGRLPKSETSLIKPLILHKTEEAEHGEWALQDYVALGGSEEIAKSESASPATFAVAAVWWRMAMAEDPFGYLGAEYLFEYLTARVSQPLIKLFQQRGMKHASLRFIVEHATEDIKHTNLLRHLISETIALYPNSAEAMFRCFDYFRQVYPIAVWNEALNRASFAADQRKHPAA